MIEHVSPSHTRFLYPGDYCENNEDLCYEYDTRSTCVEWKDSTDNMRFSCQDCQLDVYGDRWTKDITYANRVVIDHEGQNCTFVCPGDENIGVLASVIGVGLSSNLLYFL